MDLISEDEIKNIQSYTWFFGTCVEKITKLKELLTNSRLKTEDNDEILYRLNELFLLINELVKQIQTLTYDFIRDAYYLKQINHEYYELVISSYLDNFLALYSSLLDLSVNKINNNLFMNSIYDSYGSMIHNVSYLSEQEKEVYDYMIKFKDSINEVRDPRNFSIHKGVIKLISVYQDKSDFESPMLSYQFNVIHKKGKDYVKEKNWFYSILGFPRLKFYELIKILTFTFEKIKK